MKYVVVHLIRGGAGKLHASITHDLTEKFDIYPLYDFIAPHLTLKRSFEFNENRVTEIYKAVDDFATNHTQSDYKLKGFGNFDEVAVYIDVVPSMETKQNITDLQESLSKIEGISLDDFDRAQNLHATVALGKLKPFDLDQIWEYVQTLEQPDFSMKFDNVAVLKKIDGRWVIDRITEIKA